MHATALPNETALLYGDLVDLLLHSAYPGRGISFFTRKVKGHSYWYMELAVGKGKRQAYLGRDSAQLRASVERARERFTEAADSSTARKRLVSMLISGGANTVTSREARVFEALAQSGAFLVGGAIVGSHAFAAMGNMLGVRWDRQSTRTQDIDLADDYRIQLSLPDREVDVAAALQAANKGFFPVPALDPRQPSTAFKVKGETMRVDVLTPLIGKPPTGPVALRSLKASAEPVRFLEYLLEDLQVAAVTHGEGILINVPSPARFALHKLVLSQRRPAGQATKAAKDIVQAASLLSVLAEQRPGDIDIALAAAAAMPDRFQQQLTLGRKHLPTELRELIPQ